MQDEIAKFKCSKWYILKTLALLFFSEIWISFIWRLTHKLGVMTDFGTHQWCSHYNRLANFAGRIVLPSEWGGLRCVINGQEYTLSIKPIHYPILNDKKNDQKSNSPILTN